MKKLSYLLILVLTVLFASCSSCSRKEQPVDPLDVPTEFEEHLTKADTDAVKEVIEEFMTYLKQDKLYDAAGMLYRYEDAYYRKNPQLYDDKEIERFVRVHKMLPVVDYSIEYMRFREKDVNEVCIKVIMQKGETPEQDMTSKMFFNPIYMANKWRLVVDDSPSGMNTFVPNERRDSMKAQYKRYEDQEHKATYQSK